MKQKLENTPHISNSNDIVIIKINTQSKYSLLTQLNKSSSDSIKFKFTKINPNYRVIYQTNMNLNDSVMIQLNDSLM